jgi:GT2 family glycosyltransferase
MLVSIIIPFLDKWELVHQRLDEIRRLAPDDCEIILVNDCSVNDYDRQVAWWQKHGGQHEIKYVKNKENLGFGGAMNKGAEYADGDILLFLSNDVVMYNDVITPIIVANDYYESKCLMGAELLKDDTGWNKVDGKVVPYLNGYFIACHKDVWKAIGGFDLRYGKHDYEDIDLSASATSLGYQLVQLSDIKIRHMGAQTAPYGDDREKITRENQQKFMEKWSGKI